MCRKNQKVESYTKNWTKISFFLILSIGHDGLLSFSKVIAEFLRIGKFSGGVS